LAQHHGQSGQALHWWQTRAFVLAAALITAIPLIWPDIPPLVDLPGHMARYRVQLDREAYPWFNDWYNFEWQLIGNLGVDLLIIPLAKLFGLELAVKLIVLAIPSLTVTGLLWIAREVHGKIPATALFALPLAYSYPFHFGFVNFALSMALALNAFAWWLRLARLGKFGFRNMVFVPLSVLLWICHTYGWGLLGVLAFSAELIRHHDLARRPGEPWHRDFTRVWVVPWFKAGIQCLVLAFPAVLMLMWRSGAVSGETADWFNMRAKARWVTMVLRDRWQLFDLASLGVLFLILFRGIRDPNIQYSRNLGLSLLFLVAVYLMLPRIIFGSAYADMRMAPFMMAIGIVALRPKPGLSIRGAATVAAVGAAFFLIRTGGTTASFWLYDRAYDRELAALETPELPVGAPMVTFVGETCYNEWKMTRLQHLSGIGTVRKATYTNDPWSMLGGQLLTVRYRAAGRFAHDPSELVTDVKCPREWWRPIALALSTFPRDAFDYVWLISPPDYDPRLEQGLTPIWRDGDSALFRVEKDVPPAEPTRDDLPRPTKSMPF